ncbi:hypothetical protein ACIP98_28700 [Streptomyces sp. NPDC088354]|nr:hypothetical protein [Streptomyces sp. MI02-7b]MDX3076214.1 hypothetical protein [Streptomyces sp. MI02-7b]
MAEHVPAQPRPRERGRRRSAVLAAPVRQFMEDEHGTDLPEVTGWSWPGR